jgi:hypothetical protein
MSNIIRAYKNTFGGVILCFQPVEYFYIHKHEELWQVSTEDRKGYSDWAHSGDLLKTEFCCHTSNIEIDLEFKSWGLNVDSSTVSLYKLDELRTEIAAIKRLEKLVNKDLYLVGEYPDSAALKPLLNIIFKRLNVIGGTISTEDVSRAFGCDSIDKIDFIKAIIELTE